jgi:hypothetical protein
MRLAIERPNPVPLLVLVWDESTCVRFDAPVLGHQAVTTRREVQNAFESLFADTDSANDLKNLCVNRLLQHILQPLDSL